MGPNTIAQSAIPQILKYTSNNKQYYDTINKQLEKQAKNCYKQYSNIPGLIPIKARAAFYLMVCWID